MLLFVLLLAILQIKIVEMLQETNGFVMKNELPTVQINLESFFSSQNGGWCWDASDDARKNLLTFWLQTIQEVPEKIFGTERGSKINKFHVFLTKRNTIARSSQQHWTLNRIQNKRVIDILMDLVVVFRASHIHNFSSLIDCQQWWCCILLFWHICFNRKCYYSVKLTKWVIS